MMSDWSSFPKQKRITDQWRKFLAEEGGYMAQIAPLIGGRKLKMEIGEGPDQLTPEEGAQVVKAIQLIQQSTTSEDVVKAIQLIQQSPLAKGDLVVPAGDKVKPREPGAPSPREMGEIYSLIYDTASKSKIDLIPEAIAQGMATADPALIAQRLEIVQVKRASPTATMLVNIGGASTPGTFFTLESGIAEAQAYGTKAEAFFGAIDTTLDKIFGFVKLDYQRYIVATAINLYWEIILSKNPFGLDENGQWNALTIAKHQTAWLNKNVNIEAINQQRVQNQNDLKKMAAHPEVTRLLALPGAQL